MALAVTQCYVRNCKWFEGVKQPDDEEESEFYYCSAFPDGIPKDISIGLDLHEEVVEGQTGTYTYEREDDEEENNYTE